MPHFLDTVTRGLGGIVGAKTATAKTATAEEEGNGGLVRLVVAGILGKQLRELVRDVGGDGVG